MERRVVWCKPQSVNHTILHQMSPPYAIFRDVNAQREDLFIM
jgi:hypothetical protein